MINLDELTLQDLEDIEKLQEFRREAERLYNLVIANVRVPLCTNENPKFRIENRSDSHNDEFLVLKNGTYMWQARYLHQQYDVPISGDGIYRMMVSAYEFNKENSRTCYSNKNKEAIEYFKTFAENVKCNDNMKIVE